MCKRYRVDLHAYVLMTKHVHLLMTPETSDGVSRVMRSIGQVNIPIIVVLVNGYRYESKKED